MQKPDSAGFVNITWPSKNVPHGGIFHSHISNPTEGQRNLLKVLLEESKLTLAQNRKNVLALRQQEEQKSILPNFRRPMIRPRTSRRRSLSEIRDSGAFDFDKYCPLKRGEDREQLKEKLANLMTYGDNDEQPKPKVLPERMKKPELKLPTNKEKWNELVTQIRERTDWLAEMEYLGHAAPHREIIKDQIAERMRALDALGVDSECSTARSTASGFSTIKSGGSVQKPNDERRSENSSIRSDKSVKKSYKRVSKQGTGRARTTEENVAAYAQLPPLQHSPRRRQ